MTQNIISKTSATFVSIAGTATAVLAMIAVYTFYKNNLWKPSVKIIKTDYANGEADLLINGRPFYLRGDSSYLIAYDWGIKFGFTVKPDGKRLYDRIELLKKGMVQRILDKA